MYSIALIPARYGSTRFPGKPLAQIAGKSMIQRVYEQTYLAGLDYVAVATDNSEIFEHVKSFGGEVIMTSEHCLNGTERIAEVISGMQNRPEIVINVQGDEPFIKPAQIRALVRALKEPGTGIATLKKRLESREDWLDPNMVKVVTDQDDFALYFSRSPIPYKRDTPEDWPGGYHYYKHLGIYGYKTNILMELVRLSPTPLQQIENLEQLAWLETGYLIKVLETDFQSISVDVPEDLLKAEEWYLGNRT